MRRRGPRAEWTQIFADVLDRPVRVLAGEEIGARGAVSARGARSIRTAPGRVDADTRPVDLDPAGAAFYADGYDHYLAPIAQARPLVRPSTYLAGSGVR